jgi:hypothetical protein
MTQNSLWGDKPSGQQNNIIIISSAVAIHKYFIHALILLDRAA